jgi:hypothetical protein
MAIHERFGNDAIGGRGDSRYAVDVLTGECKWLFAEHMLTRVERAQRPFDVQGVRQRQIHGVNRRIAQQRFVRVVSNRDLPLGRIRAHPPRITAGDSGHCRTACRSHRGDEAPIHLGGAEEPPTDHYACCGLSFASRRRLNSSD